MYSSSTSTKIFHAIKDKYTAPLKKGIEDKFFNYMCTLPTYIKGQDWYTIVTPDCKRIYVCNPVIVTNNYNSEYVYICDLSAEHQTGVFKYINMIRQLEETISKIRNYITLLNNKASCNQDIAYALPPHINELIQRRTPETFSKDDLRDVGMYALLNELQIRLLLLS